MTNESNAHRNPVTVVVSAEGAALTEHDKGLHEVGKKILIESIESGREYCKHMIGVSSGAIPVYIALLKLGLPEKYTPSTIEYMFWIIPAILFLGAVLGFSYGYLPGSLQINVGNFNSIEGVRNYLIKRRRFWSIFGFCLLAIGIVSGTVFVMIGSGLAE